MPGSPGACVGIYSRALFWCLMLFALVASHADAMSGMRAFSLVAKPASVKFSRPTSDKLKVCAVMVSGGQQPEVFWAVVEGVVIDMMDMLGAQKRAVDHCFHNDAMFIAPALPSWTVLDLPVEQSWAGLLQSAGPIRESIHRSDWQCPHSPSPIAIAVAGNECEVSVNLALAVSSETVANGRLRSTSAPANVWLTGPLTLGRHTGKDTRYYGGVNCQ